MSCNPNKCKGFENVALRVKGRGVCKREIVTARSVRGRFYTVAKRWKTSDKAKQAIPGTAEIVTQLDDILSGTVSILNDIEDERNALKEADQKRQNAQKATMPKY